MDIKRFNLFPKLLFVALVILSFYLGHVCYLMTIANPVMVGNGKNGPQGMVWIPGKEFMMGSDSHLAKDNEKPAHKVRVDGFWMDQTDVTNAQFAAFVNATHYVTTAERKPDWATLAVQLAPNTPKPPEDKMVAGAMVFVGTDHAVPLDDNSLWWRFVPGADWRHPQARLCGVSPRRIGARHKAPANRERSALRGFTLSRAAGRYRPASRLTMWFTRL